MSHPIRVLVGFALMILLCGSASAGVIASGYLADFRTPANLLNCSITNVGSKPIKIVSVQILDLFGPENFTTGCGATLDPGATCNTTASNASGRGVVEFSGSANNVRGLCLLSGPSGLVGTAEMR